MTIAMKHTHVVGATLALAMLLTGGAFASAQSTTTEEQSSSTPRIEQEPPQNQESASATDQFKENLKEHRAQFAKRVQDRIYNLTDNIRSRMHAAIDRLSSIADRLESRAKKTQAEGRNVDDVLASISRARESLASARARLAPDLGQFIQSDRPKEQFIEVKNTIGKARQEISDAHTSLMKAFLILKNGGIPAADTASGTKPTN